MKSSSLLMLISKLRFKKLRSRFLAAMILISLPPLFILGYISFNIAKDTLMTNHAQTNEDHLKTESEVADLLFSNIINLNRAIVVNDEIRDVLKSSNTSQSSEQYKTNEWTTRLQKVMNDHLFDTKFVSSICVFNLDFRSFCAGRSDDAGIYEKENKAILIQQTDWYKNASQAQGRVLFYGYDILGDSKNVFSTVKLFRDGTSPNGDPIGLLIVNISKSIFNEVFNNSNDHDGFMALDATKGMINVVFNKGLSSAEFPKEGHLNTSLNQIEQKGYLVNQYNNQTTDWTFVHLTKLQDLLKQSNKIRWITTLIAVSMAIIALIISIIISGSITRPLLQIKKMMVDWTKGNRRFIETFEEDEVGTIGKTFIRMSSENKELNQRIINSELKKREAELRALQAQIKPHFLYNTLDSIYWMAVIQKNNDIAQMAVSLSESFKLSLNKGKELITVYKELKHIEHYMTIQNIRYNNRFQYIQEIDSALMGMEIMKLLLQPLVENAIYHGLEPKVGDGIIRLSGHRDGDHLIFIVEDNGVGIADIGLTEQGYGLRNVRERLKLYYGTDSSLQIFSVVNEGTTITIRFKPFSEKGNIHAESSRI
jgi:two-component system sensor histidine kinase YesM